MPAPIPRAPPVTMASLPVSVVGSAGAAPEEARGVHLDQELGRRERAHFHENSLRAFHTASRCLMSVT